MANAIFGKGLAAQPLVIVPTPAVVPAFKATPKPVYVTGGNIPTAKGAAVANATDAATAITQLNALLASLRAAGVIAP